MVLIMLDGLALANGGASFGNCLVEVARRSSAPRTIMHMEEAQDSLTDGDLQSEIELVGDLVVAASSSDGPLPQGEIDRLLGVETHDQGDPSVDQVPAADR